MQSSSDNTDFIFQLETIVRFMIQDITTPILKQAAQSQNKWDDLQNIIKQMEQKFDQRNQKTIVMEHIFDLKANEFEILKKKVYDIDKNQLTLTSQNQSTLQKMQSESDIIQRMIKDRDDSFKQMADKYDQISKALTETTIKLDLDISKQRQKIIIFQKDILDSISQLQSQTNLQNEKLEMSYQQHENQMHHYGKLNQSFIQQQLNIDDIREKLTYMNDNFCKYVRKDEMNYQVNELRGLISLNKEDYIKKLQNFEDQQSSIEKLINEQYQQILEDCQLIKQDILKQVQFLTDLIKKTQNAIYDSIEKETKEREKKFELLSKKLNEQKQDTVKLIQQNIADTNIRLESKVFEGQQIIANQLSDFKLKYQQDQLMNYQKTINDIIFCNEQRCRQLIKQGIEGHLEEPDGDLIYNPLKFQEVVESKIEKFTIQYVENSEYIKQIIENQYKFITQTERKQIEQLAKSSEQDKNKLCELLAQQETKYLRFFNQSEKTQNDFNISTSKIQKIEESLKLEMDEIFKIKENLSEENQKVKKINQQTEVIINKIGNQMVQLKSDSEIYHQYLNSQINHAVNENTKNNNYIKGLINWLTSLNECVNVGFCIQYNNLSSQEKFIQLPSYFDDVLMQRRFDPITNQVSYRVKTFDQETILYKVLNGLQMRYKYFVQNFMPDMTCQSYFDKEILQQNQQLNRMAQIHTSQPKIEQEPVILAQKDEIMKKRKKLSSASLMKNRTRIQSIPLTIEGTNDFSETTNQNVWNSLSMTPINRPIHTQVETTQDIMKDFQRGKFLKPHNSVRKKKSETKRPMTGVQRVQVLITQ